MVTLRKLPRLFMFLAFLALLLPQGLGLRSASAGTVDIWVDPVSGANTNTGSSRATAVRTLAEAWRRIPIDTTLTSGYRIRLVAGTYASGTIPVYMERRWGTASNPIRIEAADGAGTAILQDDLNIYDVRHLTLFGLVIRLSGDVVHCERCRHFRIEQSVLDGRGAAHETLKVNQSTYVDLIDSEFSGAYENAIDFVAVQYGTISGNRIHSAEDWCIYLKGGSAQFWIEGNEIYDCGTGGFTAGQGTGFQYMVAPWLTYEAEDITFIRNHVHDTYGAGMGVNGGSDIVLAENRLERIGARSHLLEVTFGLRSCDGEPGDLDRERCVSYLAAGGWGTTATGSSGTVVRIPNKRITVRDNTFVNPPTAVTRWQHFEVPGPFSGGPQVGSNAPDPAYADDGLVITGNIIRNGDTSMPLGVGESGTGCRETNPTCNPTQLLRDNDINGTAPVATVTRTPTRTPTPGVGAAFQPAGSAASLNGEPSSVVRDGDTQTIWRTRASASPPQSGWVLVQLGAVKPVAEFRWLFGMTDIADSFRIQVHASCRDRPTSGWVTVANRSNARVGRWQTFRPASPINACQVRFRFSNPNGDLRLGGLSEIRLFRPLNWAGSTDLSPAASPTPPMASPTPTGTAVPPVEPTITPAEMTTPPGPTIDASPPPTSTPTAPPLQGSPLATAVAGG